MKQSWTRLADIVRKQGGNTKFMYGRFDALFMRHHRHAHEIVLDRSGRPMAAVYFTPEGMQPDHLRSFIRALRERTEAPPAREEGGS